MGNMLSDLTLDFAGNSRSLFKIFGLDDDIGLNKFVLARVSSPEAVD